MASFFRQSGDRIQCTLCPHLCRIAEGRTGICGVRKNTGKVIELITYGVVSGYALDPVEKKPLYHFYPGYNILSVGSYGCNMRCDFCQNYNISQSVPSAAKKGVSGEELVLSALDSHRNIGLAFTYNEPMIWFEYVRDVSFAIRNAGMKTVLVSNGYVTAEPLKEIIDFTDAFNIDLKAFNQDSYKKLTGADLEPVKSTLKKIAASGRHLEITSLIIPGHNDKENEIRQQAEWIAGELGKDIPLHLSRYFPMYKRDDPATTTGSIRQLFEIASEKLDFVYMGNIQSDEGQNTMCPSCKTTVTQRKGYTTEITNLDSEGRCTGCGTQVYKNFTFLKES
jgi:pyruvate formate lyase activating enzyme